MCATKWNLPRFFPIYSPSYCTFSPPIEAKNEEKNVLSFRMQNDSTWLFNWIHWNGRARDRGVCKPQSHQQQCVQHNQRRIVTNYHGCILLSSVLCLMYLSWCKTKHVTKLPPFGCWCCGLCHVHIYAVLFLFANTFVYLHKVVVRVVLQKQTFLFSLVFLLICMQISIPLVAVQCLYRKFKLNSTEWTIFDGSDCRIFPSQRALGVALPFVLFYWFNLFHFTSFDCDSLILHS